MVRRRLGRVWNSRRWTAPDENLAKGMGIGKVTRLSDLGTAAVHLQEAKDQLDHVQAALEESKDKVAQAQSAKEAAEAAPGTGEKSYAPVDVARRSPVQS